MHVSHLHYLPLSPLFFSIFVATFFLLIALVQVNALHCAYTCLGVTSGTALLLLLVP